jgi:hypothetical protein
MRIRAVVAFVSLLLPATALSAQRVPVGATGRRGPARPAPLPPQPAPIARALAYKRMRLSVESYPLVSYVQSPGFVGAGQRTSWTTFGAGTRADYRLNPFVSATMDMTSSFVGGPALTQTAELGTRLHRERSEGRVYPFADLRVGYVSAYNRSVGAVIDDAFGSPSPDAYGVRYGQGFGAVAGVGMEYGLTRMFSLTTAASVMRNRMTSRGGFSGAQNIDRTYAMTSYRYTLGLRYNPVRVIRPPGDHF